MGAKALISQACAYRGKQKKWLAQKNGAKTFMEQKAFYNRLHRDTLGFNIVEKYASDLGFDVVFRDRKTGFILDGHYDAFEEDDK